MFRFFAMLFGPPLKEAATHVFAWGVFFFLWAVSSAVLFAALGLPYWLANGGQVGKHLWAAIGGAVFFGIVFAGAFIDNLVKADKPEVTSVRGKELDTKIQGE